MRNQQRVSGGLRWRLLGGAHLPADLAQHAEPDDSITGGQIQAADQAANALVCVRHASQFEKTAQVERVEKHRRDSLHFVRGCRREFFVQARLLGSRASSYRHSATAWPRFMERSVSTVGMRISQWQWLISSFDKPNFSDPNSSPTGAFDSVRADEARSVLEPSQRVLQFAMAHRRGPHHQHAIRHRVRQARKSSAVCSRGAAPTADRASRNATSYGFTTRRREKPKFAMARAAAPILSGLRVDTSTTRRRSS